MKYEIRDIRNRETICHVNLAKTTISRGLGLMFKRSMPKDYGLLIEFPTWTSLRILKTVHGFLMFFSIDLVFIDKDLKVVDITTLNPYKWYTPKTNCKWVLEVNQGIVKDRDLRVGDVLEFKEIA